MCLKIGGCLVPYAERPESVSLWWSLTGPKTLWPHMASRIAAGSTVYTDSVAVYDGITGLGMNWIYLKVNHRKKFVRHVLYRGHVYIVHTNTIERLWRHIKSFIRSPQSPNFLFEQVDWAVEPEFPRPEISIT
jgi:hypothetical protein